MTPLFTTVIGHGTVPIKEALYYVIAVANNNYHSSTQWGMNALSQTNLYKQSQKK